MTIPRIIFLHGSTSAGKSSIARALQARLDGLWLHIGVDHFLQMTPLKYHGVPEGIRFVPQPDGSLPIELGPIGMQIIEAFHHGVRAIAQGGTGIIIDDVILSEASLRHWAHELNGLDVFFVGVHCTQEELQRREIARGDRGIGQVRAQFPVVHTLTDYDFTVDTTSTDSETCANAIIAAFVNRAAPSIFERLRATL